MTTDKLKATLTEELKRITADRDEHRALALKHQDYSKKLDGQLNRLQHFLADYDEIETPDLPKSKYKRIGVKKNIGAGKVMIDVLTSMYPEPVPFSFISKEIKDAGFSPNCRSSLERLVANDRVVKSTNDGGIAVYQLVIPNHTVEAGNGRKR